MLPAIRPKTRKHADAGSEDEGDGDGGGGGEGEGEDEDEDGDGDAFRRSRMHTAARPKTSINFVNVEGDGDGDDDGGQAWGSAHRKDGAGGGGEGELQWSEDGGEGANPQRSKTASEKIWRGRTPVGYMEWSQRPATQGGPNGYFPSALPPYAQARSALKRGRAVLKKPGVKVFQQDDQTYDVDPETRSASLALRRLSRTAHGKGTGYERQKKLLSVPFVRKKRPATTSDVEPEHKVIPAHLQKRWRFLTSIDERRDLEKNYNTRYKEKEVLAWKVEDVFSFVADCFINETQVDVKGIPLPKKLVKEDGVQADRCLDMLVMRQVKVEMMDGKKLMAKVQKNLLAKSLKLESYDPTLADAISTAAQDYLRLNARKKVDQHEGVTAQEAFQAAHADNSDEALMQELMVKEVALKKVRARLRDLRDKLAPLQNKFAEGVDDFKSLEEHYDRIKTPDVRAFVRPKSRRNILALKKAVDEDLTVHHNRWLALTKEEQALAQIVREDEMQTLALRQKVETAQKLREARRKELWDEQSENAFKVESERDIAMIGADGMLRACDELLHAATNAVQTQFDRSQRDEMLRMIGDKIFQAKKICMENCRYHLRRKRIETLEISFEFAVEKLREGDTHLAKVQAHLVAAAAVEDSSAHVVTHLTGILKDCRQHMYLAKRDYKRRDALSMVEYNLRESEQSVEELEARIESIVAAQKQQNLDAAAAKAAEAAAAAEAAKAEEVESEEEEAEESEFDKTLSRLIQEKQRQALERVADSLCSMQQWLFEVKSKSKGKGPSSSAGDSVGESKTSQSSTRPASPWASRRALPPVPGHVPETGRLQPPPAAPNTGGKESRKRFVTVK